MEIGIVLIRSECVAVGLFVVGRHVEDMALSLRCYGLKHMESEEGS